jgi:hypothetical protein
MQSTHGYKSVGELIDLQGYFEIETAYYVMEKRRIGYWFKEGKVLPIFNERTFVTYSSYDIHQAHRAYGQYIVKQLVPAAIHYHVLSTVEPQRYGGITRGLPAKYAVPTPLREFLRHMTLYGIGDTIPLSPVHAPFSPAAIIDKSRLIEFGASWTTSKDLLSLYSLIGLINGTILREISSESQLKLLSDELSHHAKTIDSTTPEGKFLGDLLGKMAVFVSEMGQGADGKPGEENNAIEALLKPLFEAKLSMPSTYNEIWMRYTSPDIVPAVLEHQKKILSHLLKRFRFCLTESPRDFDKTSTVVDVLQLVSDIVSRYENNEGAFAEDTSDCARRLFITAFPLPDE